MTAHSANGGTLDTLEARIAVAEARITAAEKLAKERDDFIKERFHLADRATSLALAGVQRSHGVVGQLIMGAITGASTMAAIAIAYAAFHH